MEHTKEPWSIGKPPPNGEQTIGDSKGLMVAVATTGDGVSSEANARRIVACVNACVGVGTEYLEDNGPIIELVREHNTVLKQRDELLAFAEEVRRSGNTRLASMAIAAIASAKGSLVEDKGIGGFKPWVATHLKTGNEYRVIGEAIDATNAAESRTVVIYRGNGQTFVRCADEFMDKFSVKGGA